MTPFLSILGQFFHGSPHLAYYWLTGLYSSWVSDKYSYLLKLCCNYWISLNYWIIVIVEIFKVSILYISMKVIEGNNNLGIFLKHWKPQEKIKCWFIQEPWMYFFVKSQNSQILYIIKIIFIFSKFAQKICFCLIVASLYLIRSKLKIFIHSFISCRLPCPNEFFQVELSWRKYNEKLYFRT